MNGSFTALRFLNCVFLVALWIAPAACDDRRQGQAEGEGRVARGQADVQERCSDCAERLNAVLITMDTTRADRLSVYGGRPEVSPVLERLAREGVVFEQAISASGITAPAHASILTGLYPHNHGLRIFTGDKGVRIKVPRDSLPRVLESHGWSTAAFVSSYPVSERYGFDGLFQVFDSGALQAAAAMARGEIDVKRFWQDRKLLPSQRRADATTQLAIDWLREADSPFFLWVHYFDPHDPRLVPPKAFIADFNSNIPQVRGRTRSRRSAYEPEIAFMDQQIGVLLDYLVSSGADENTLVVALADHGQGLGDHGWFFHRLLYQEQIHVPLIVRLPKSMGRTPERVDAIVRSVDVYPTVLDVLGLPLVSGRDGRSLMPLLRGQPEAPRFGLAEALNTLDFSVASGLPKKQRDRLFALVEGRWKAIYHVQKPNNSELYDLRTDPRERINLASKRPDLLQAMIAKIESTGAMSVAFSRAESAEVEHTEQLRALGYVE